MRKNKVLLAVAMAGTLALAGCGSDAPANTSAKTTGDTGADTSATKPLKVGVIIPQSGNFAPEGEEVKRGYELALKKFGGKCDLTLEYGDAFAPEDATAEVDRLGSREKVDLLMGSYATATSQAASDAAARLGITYIETHAVTDSLTERGLPNYFRTGARARDFGGASADFIIKGLAPAGIKSVFIEHEEGPYGTSVSETQVKKLKAAGINVVGNAAHSPGATDVTDSVLAAKRAKPDVWLITSYAGASQLMLKTAAQQNFRPKAIVLTGAGDTRAVFDAVGPKIIKDVFVVAYSSEQVEPAWAPGNAEFYSSYRKTYNSDPLGSVANVGYVGMQSALKLLEASNCDPDSEAVAKAAAGLSEDFGATSMGWGLKFNDGNSNEAIRLLTTQWRETGISPAVFPEEAAPDDQKMVLPTK